MSKIFYISCLNNEKDYISIFRIIESVKNEKIIPQEVDSDLKYLLLECKNCNNKYDIINSIKDGNYAHIDTHNDFTEFDFLIDITISESNEEDIISYRYLALIASQLLNSRDIINISCDFAYYNKIASFFLLETIKKKDLMYVYTGKNNEKPRAISLALKVSLSNEWIPFIDIHERVAFQILSTPIGDKLTYDYIVELIEKNTINSIINFNIVLAAVKNKGIPIEKVVYFAFINKCIKNLEGHKDFNKIIEWIESAPLLSSLLFAIQVSKVFEKKKKNIINTNKLKKLYFVSCDYGESLLQVIENALNYSNGACFTFRINKNKYTILDEFDFDAVSDMVGYIRMSLVDYSLMGISEHMTKKLDLKSPLPLEQIFDNNLVKADSEYGKYIFSDNGLIYHYGLPIFRSMVSEHKGCFTVKSSSQYIIGDDNIYSCNLSGGIRYRNKRESLHIPGTEYDIVLPFFKNDIYNTNQNITSVSFECDYDQSFNHSSVVSNEYLSTFFSKRLNKIIEGLMETKELSYQDIKEQTINIAAEELSTVISEPNKIYYLYVNEQARKKIGRIEIIAKTLIKSISLLKKPKANIVIFGLDNGQFEAFIRQFAMFYRNDKKCHIMKDSQIYAVSYDYETEVLFYGESLDNILSFLNINKNLTGIDSHIIDIVDHIVNRISLKNSKIHAKSDLSPINFDVLPRLEIDENKTVFLSNNKLCLQKLDTVLNNDLHGEALGCKISDIHVRTNGIHLDSFYEAQLLFVNSFWCSIFSNYLFENLTKDIGVTSRPILLLGYETYSEPMLFSLRKMLIESGCSNVWYSIFENAKFINPQEKREKRFKYLDNFFDCNNENAFSNAILVFVCGISTTLSTLKNSMFEELKSHIEKMNKRLDTQYTLVPHSDKQIFKGFIIIQIACNKKNDFSSRFIEINEKDNIVCSKQGYTDFFEEKHCKFLISVKSEWYDPRDCKKCFPDDYKNESVLIETNEASTVPMVLIKPNNKKSINIDISKCTKYTKKFLSNPKNQKYLYYTHLHRGGNHHQYYIRTAALLYDNIINNDNTLKKWLDCIRNQENSLENNVINIIVSPSHFSVETLVTLINDKVFDGKAHIINFDVKKEFRSSFESEFSNYTSMLNMAEIQHDSVVNFYYVDDQINTGSTFLRAKSLINGLIFDDASNIKLSYDKINVFKAIILLINRNSSKSLCNYFDLTKLNIQSDKVNLPLYSFIDLNTPSIRSYGDSCPICKKVVFLNELIHESSLNMMEKYWTKKRNYHNLKSLRKAKEEKIAYQNGASSSYHKSDVFSERGFRCLQCSEEIWKCIPSENEDLSFIKETIQNCILDYLLAVGNRIKINSISNELANLKIEYLISFIKVISRPHLSYQESVNSAALQISLDLYSLLFDDGNTYSKITMNDFYKNILMWVENCSDDLRYDLFCILVSRVCSLGSCMLFEKNRLTNCYQKGEILYAEAKLHKNYSEDFFVFLCSQIKKTVFANKDYPIRTEKMSELIENLLQEELSKKEDG